MWETVACIFTVLASLALPIAALIWFAGKRDRLTAPFLLGALTFLVFQTLTRIPLIEYVLPKMGWYSALPMVSPVLFALFLGITAALFEECGRYIVMRLFMRKRTRYIDGIAFGLGHGGIEAMLMAGTSALLTLFIPGGPAAAGVDGAVALASGFERLFTMTLHIGWSLMVLQSMRNGKIKWLLLALATHTAVDTVGLLLQPLVSTLAIEAVVAAAAALMTIYIVHTKKHWEACKS